MKKLSFLLLACSFFTLSAQQIQSPSKEIQVEFSLSPEGEPIYQGLDLTRIVPLLSAALKETLTKVEALEAKVASLRSN